MSDYIRSLKPIRCHCINTSQMVGPIRWIKHLQPISSIPRGAIVCSDRLSVSEVSKILSHKPVGVIMSEGGLIDHAAQLLNSAGVQLAITALGIPSSGFAAIDGVHEEIFFDEQIERPKRWLSARTGGSFATVRPTPGFDVGVSGNFPEQLRQGISNGASFIGLYKTEWFGWNERQPPSADAMRAVYTDAVEKVAPLRLNIRLYDIGGDKLPKWAVQYATYLESPMGARGIRFHRLMPGLYEKQIEAIVGCEGDIGIVLPMVTSPDEITKLNRMIQNVAGSGYRNRITLGAVIETPAAALRANEFAEQLDFIRIGTCDLAQFTLATKRDKVSPVDFSGSSVNPALMRLCEYILSACKDRNIPCTFNLHFEPRSELINLLIKAGFRSFAVSFSSVQPLLRHIDSIARPAIEKEIEWEYPR